MRYIVTAWCLFTQSCLIFPNSEDTYTFEEAQRVYQSLSSDKQRFSNVRISYIVGV